MVKQTVCFRLWYTMLQNVAVQLICIVVCFHQAVRGEAVRSVIGYINEAVVLKSEANSSWTLKSILWSIYQNTTLIATFDNNEVKVNRFYRFLGRLELNTTSGDLTIQNLKAGDSLEYKVKLEGQQGEDASNSVQLNVREPFPGPSITLLHSVLHGEHCLVVLKCTSPSSNISLMWEPEQSFTEHFCSDPDNVNGESMFWTYFKNRDVTFSCNATDYNRIKSSQKTVKCSDQVRTNSIWLPLGYVLFVSAMLYIFRGQIKDKCSSLLRFCAPQE